MNENDLSSSFISLIYCACFPASYLTFAASYQNKKANVKQMAKYILSNQYSSHTSVAILDEIPLCTDGNHPDFRKLEKLNFCL